MKDSDFACSYANDLSYLCHKVGLNRSRSYRDYSDWIKSNETINPLRKYDDKCFQCAATLALNRKEITEDSQRISKAFYRQI